MAASSFTRRCKLLQSLRCVGHVKREQIVRTTFSAKRSLRPYLAELYERRKMVGPEPMRHPSKFGCWNFESEWFSFGKRLGEEFDQDVLQTAFTTRSFVEHQLEEKRKLGLEVSEDDMSLQDNSILAEKGEEICSKYAKAFLRHSYPYLFEEAIQDIHDHLMSDETLNFVSQRIGTTDLTLAYPEYPPSEADLVKVFKAVVGALAESQDEERAGEFVKDFLLVQLIGKDINEMWNLVNPMGVLTDVLQELGRGPPEPRLLRSSAQNTILAVYHVGIYSDKQLIGKSPGETEIIAEEMAARNALKNLMKTDDARAPMKFDVSLSELNLDFDRLNPSLKSVASLEKQSSVV